MILKKPKFWDQKIGIKAILLIPLTLTVIIISILKKKIVQKKKFDVPIICVGNIYIGGTGKTPLSIFLGNELKKLGHNPAIVRKSYKTHADEHKMIKEKFESLILCKNRILGIKNSLQANFDSIILDDGYQDQSIKKDLNIICFNQNQLVGNGMVMPSGPLRESLKSLNEANIILINGKKDKNFEEKILKINKNLEIFYSIYKPMNLEEFKNKRLFAIAGIGNPENFFKLIEENNLKIEKRLIFPDHHIFSLPEVKKIEDEARGNNCQIIMTEKDYFKIRDFNLENAKYLKISLEIKEKNKLINKINNLYAKKN